MPTNKTRCCRFLAHLILLGAPIQQCLAQRYPFQMYGQAEGLTNLSATALAQDSTGFLWVGTQNGLFRYDGSRFDAFGTAQGLPTSEIVSVVDSAGTLLVATTGGVAFFTHEHFLPVPFNGSMATTTRRQGLAADNGENVYLATAGGLLVRRHRAPDVLLRPSGADPAVYSVYQDPKGKLWAGCGNRLCTVENQSLAVVPGDLPADRWHCFRNDRNGNLWMLGDRSIRVRRAATGKFEPLPPMPFPTAAGFAPLLGDPVLELAWNGDVIASAPVGLCQWDGKRWRLIDQRSGLPSTDVGALLADREGSLWVGLAGLGLARWLGYSEWENWGTPEGLANDSIWSIHRDAAGTIWVGTRTGLAFARGGPESPSRWTVRAGIRGPDDSLCWPTPAITPYGWVPGTTACSASMGRLAAPIKCCWSASSFMRRRFLWTATALCGPPIWGNSIAAHRPSTRARRHLSSRQYPRKPPMSTTTSSRKTRRAGCGSPRRTACCATATAVGPASPPPTGCCKRPCAR